MNSKFSHIRIKLKRRALFCMLIFFIASALSADYAYAGDKPEITNVYTYTLQQIEDLPQLDICADLTKCQYIGKEFDVKVLEHDSLTSVLFPERRYDFTNRQDTILLVCEENRAARLSFPSGLVISTGNDNSYISGEIDGHGRYRQRYKICAKLTATLFPATAATLISTHCDTLADFRFDHVRRICRFSFASDSVTSIDEIPETAVVTSTTDTYTLSTIDEAFPRVLKKVSRLSGSDCNISDSVTYILVSSPTKKNTGRQKSLPRNRVITPATFVPTVSIAPDGNSITIVPNGQYSDIIVIICDVSGRVFITDKVCGNDISVVDITSLPRGEYLIQLVSEDKTLVVKKYSNIQL